jgi:hypothetical protein
MDAQVDGGRTELIPLGVRIAVRNAVGGSGPFTVAEIHDLFQSYTFAQEADVEDAGGERRTTAERHQACIDFGSPVAARSYLNLVSEVLSRYPKNSSQPNDPGSKLRLRLRGEGITELPDGRLSHPRLTEGQPPTPIETDDLWTPGAIRIFMSHVSEHKARVGQIGDLLSSFGFSCFVAHDAIQPSRAWQEAIERALRTCHVLVAYLSPEFSRSHWTDQEVGWAAGRGIPIVPIDAGANPYGFFGAFQALKTSAEMPVSALALEVTRAIAIAAFHQSATNFPAEDAMADLIVEAFCTSPGYESTRQRFTLLQLIPAARWNAARRVRIEGALVGNRQIAEANLRGPTPVPDAVRELIARRTLQQPSSPPTRG